MTVARKALITAQEVVDRLGPMAPVLLIVATVAAYALSYFISLGIMEKKEL